MEQRFYHGKIKPEDIANTIFSKYNRGNLRVQTLGKTDHLIVQVSTLDRPRSGGTTAITISIQKTPDGIGIQVGEQDWLGIVASLGQSALWTWLNPLNIISRLDDIAHDLENLQLKEKIWETIEETTRNLQVSQNLSDRFRRLTCSYCLTANPVGSGNCIACGAPLGALQPSTCKNCGFLIQQKEEKCPNCGRLV